MKTASRLILKHSAESIFSYSTYAQYLDSFAQECVSLVVNAVYNYKHYISNLVSPFLRSLACHDDTLHAHAIVFFFFFFFFFSCVSLYSPRPGRTFGTCICL